MCASRFPLDENIIRRAAEIARVVVHTEQAFDILDELSSNPEMLDNALTKISRLIVKVLNDIDKELKELKGEECRRTLENSRRDLLRWPEAMKGLVDELQRLRYSEESKKEFARAVKRFAAYTLSMDIRTENVRRILWGEETCV